MAGDVSQTLAFALPSTLAIESYHAIGILALQGGQAVMFDDPFNVGAKPPTLVTDARNLVTKTEYDNLNRPITVTTNYVNGVYDPAKPDEDIVHVTHYDPAGNVIEQIEPSSSGALDRVTRTWYDNLNRPITVTRNYVDGQYNPQRADEDLTTITTYDAAGNAIQSLDPLQHPAWFRYDGLNRLISTTNALSGTTLTQYDGLGNRVLVTDVLTHATRYEYDQLNRLITTTFPLTGWVVNTYDPAGNRTRVSDALGHATVYTYDLPGRWWPKPMPWAIRPAMNTIALATGSP